MNKNSDALRKIALTYPAAEEGIACAGTALERRTIKAKNKAFLFLGATGVMLKLGDSIAEATKLGCTVGAHGWVNAPCDGKAALPLGVLRRWVEESYRLIAGKQLVALLPERRAKAATKSAARRATARKP